MNVLALGAGPRVAEYLSALREVVGLKGQAPPATRSPVAQSQAALSDAIAPLLRQLSEPDVSKLLVPATPTPAPETAVRMERLLQESVAADADAVARTASRPPAAPGDPAATPLGRLTKQDVVKFLELIGRPPLPETVSRIEGLLRASVAAAKAGDVPQALARLTEIAALDPRRAEALDREPGLAPIERDVSRFQSRLASTAHMDAEARLDRAAHLLGSVELKELLRTEPGPRMAIAVADRLLEARGYANCVYSAQLSQSVIDRYGYVPAPATPELAAAAAPAGFARALPVWRDRWTARIRNLWQRAPLLILLLAWFGVGLAGGCVSATLRHWWPETWPESALAGGFELWAVGFLALVGFGFYARVRSVR
jgi:hypothetical protein